MADASSEKVLPLVGSPSRKRRLDNNTGDQKPRYSSPGNSRDHIGPKFSMAAGMAAEMAAGAFKGVRGRPESRTSNRSGSRSRAHSRSESRSRSRSRSPSRNRSRASSDSRSRSPRSQSPSYSRSRSPRSRSVDQSRSESPQPTPPVVERPPITPNYQPVFTLSGHERAVSQVRISPDGRWIASASADGTAKIWDAATGEHQETMVGHMAGISCLAWHPDSNIIATGSDDKSIRLWDRITGLPAHSVHMAESGDEEGHMEMRLRQQKLQQERQAKKKSGESRKNKTRGGPTGKGAMTGHHNYVYCLAFSPKGNILASGSYDEAVFLWDVRAARLMRSLPAHSDPVSGIGFCRDGTLVVSCSTDGLIRLWDTLSGQCLRTLVHEDNPPIAHCCFTPNGRFVVAWSLDNSIRLWDYVSKTVKKTYQGHKNSGFSVGGCVGVLSDADDGYTDEDGETKREMAFITSASEDGDIIMWDINTKQVIQRISKAHDAACMWADVNGKAMVSCGKDNLIKVYRHQPAQGRKKKLTNGTTPNGATPDGVNGHATEKEGEGEDQQMQDHDEDVQMDETPQHQSEQPQHEEEDDDDEVDLLPLGAALDAEIQRQIEAEAASPHV